MITESDIMDFLCVVAVLFGLALGLWLGCKVVDRLSADSPLLRITIGRTAQRKCLQGEAPSV